MDLATVGGLLCAFGLILFGNHLEGGHLSSVIQPTAALIVFGGTFGAVMVGFPMEDFVRALKSLGLFFSNKAADSGALLEEIVRYAQIARREGIIALEEHVQKATDPFFKRAFLMVVDGIDSKSIAETLELELHELDEKGEIPAKVYEAAGGYCPTVGILGAVLGLIHVMSNLSDIEKVGSGIAVAFVATIYGVGAANLVCLPAANKLKMKHRAEMVQREMIMHGAIAIQQGENPKLIEGKLSVFVHGHGKKHGAGPAKAKAAA
ncbi:MAG: flagellar motor protein [Planctomycetes bacterium]|nr:flagellar motor protein [Planctomycetota bacterium]